MNAIQQLYCTHCTHGSSALERRQGELAARMLGYTVRAGSLEDEPLRQLYRQIERYVSYHLPRDTPSEEKLQLTAASAPHRLIFIPAAGAWQVIGQVCYRQRDTEGRPGSYFAHLLCREAGPDDQRWTLLDALRLWNAPGWTIEDSENHPFVLPEVPDLDSMLGGKPPQIDDRALMEFLQGDDRSVGARLPDRWRDLVPARRIEILKEMLGSLLTIGTTRRQTLLVAVEPEAAAMLFYGVGRLLPPGVLRESVSLSTFETSTDRLTTVLAATTFANPQTAEFRTDALRGRGLALNTFAPSPAASENESLYADRMIRRLFDEGPEALDHRLTTLAAAQPERIERLEDFAQTEQAVDMLFRSSGGSSDESWRSEASLTDYARRLTRQRLEALEGAESTLGSLCGGVSHWTIVELAATKPPGSAADRALRFLLAKLPDDRIAPLVANGDVDDAWKTELLQSRIATTGRTPPGCQWLWSDEASQSPLGPERQKSLALDVMARLPSKAVVGMLSSLESDCRLTAVDQLVEACGRTPEQWAVFADVIRRLDVASLLAVWQRLQSRLFEVPDNVGVVLSARLREILDSLHEHPSEFQERLKFVEAGGGWLTEPDEANRLAAWARCRAAVTELAGMNEPASGLRQLTALRRLESAAQRMTEAVLEAMPATLVEDDRQGRAKQDCLRAIGRQMLEGKEFLPPAQWQNEALWKKVGWRMEMGSWPTMALRKLSRTPEAQKRMWIAVSVAAAVVLGVLAVIGMATMGTHPGPSTELVIEPGSQRTEKLPAPVDESPKQNVAPPQPDALSEGDLAARTPVEEASQPTANGSQTTPESPRDAGEQIVRESFEKPLVMLAGDFKAAMSPVAALEPPVVAVLRLHVRNAEGQPLPEQILRKYAIGAVVREQSGAGNSRLLDLPDLDHGNEAQLFDGVDHVLIQFRCSRKATAASPGGIQAASRSWAEVMITPAQRYDIRFLLSPEAVKTLEQLAAAEQTELVAP